jgi:hypothetical protein
MGYHEVGMGPRPGNAKNGESKRMTRLILASLLALGLGLAVSPARAADHKGHHHCCKAQMHECEKPKKHGCCAYLPCCEIGNRGFFTKKACESCRQHVGKKTTAKMACCCTDAPK